MKTLLAALTAQPDSRMWNALMALLHTNDGNDQLGGPDWIPMAHEARFGSNLLEKVSSGRLILFAAELGSSDPIFVGLDDVDLPRRRARLVYVLSETVRKNKDYVDAFRELLKYAFNSLDLRRLTSFVRKSSLPLQTSLASFGFQKEGLLREYLRYEDGSEDLLVYGLLRSECHVSFV